MCKESGVRSQESGVRSQESGVRSQESGVRSQEEVGKFICYLSKSKKMHTFSGIPLKTLALFSSLLALRQAH
ncbi:hypothetical protein [Sphaerospermopsis sp. FACHB-1194]|uniref:hypothetical protein n=1 Tax=Sphaerospermopsis sp. FACHB-1194 TaxID=2692862 RepID=UPI0016808EDE|nr:hypothetical protein [Sphaerospermopsis sp. FACHB-1194]MBD2144023.1 hypothetical protein [Sphaerospermopsis sp. FACHB-1194]